MKKMIIRGIALFAALAMLAAFPGCLRFSNSLDLSKPLNNDSSVSEQPTGASEPGTTLPAGTEPSGTGPSETESTNGTDTENTTEAPAESTTGTPAESTTGTPDENTTGTPAESTTGAQSLQDYVRSLGTTDYDVLRSNNCSIVGSLESPEGVNPMELSIAPDKLYIVSEMEGMQIGMYVEGKKTYIYLPKHQSYLKLSNTVAKLIGMDPSEFSSMADELGFDALPPLTEAESMQDAVVDGVACKQFIVRANGEVTRIYMKGPKLISIDYLEEDGSIGSTMRFTSVSAGFPQMPPAGYNEIGYMDFAKIIMSEME